MYLDEIQVGIKEGEGVAGVEGGQGERGESGHNDETVSEQPLR